MYDNDNMSRLSTCLNAAHHFLLSKKQAVEIIETQMHTIAARWSEVCAEASLSEVDRNLFWGRQFLNPYAFAGCVFRAKLDAQSTANWTPSPRQTGQQFRSKLNSLKRPERA